jgi:hypothetical protein
MSYGCRELDRFAESEFWADWTFCSKSGFWWNFAMTSPETLNTKVAANELSFPLVTHMAYSDARFDSYGISKSGWGAENFLDRLSRPENDQILGAEMHKFWWGLFINSIGHWLSFPTPTHTHIFGNHNSGYSCFNTTTCRVQRITVKRNRKRFRFGFGLRRDYSF